MTEPLSRQIGIVRALGRVVLCAMLTVATVAMLSSVTGVGTSADRTLYFKLPIEGVRFHWEFLDAEAFLSGELTLRILNKDRDQTLVVFRDGKDLLGRGPYSEGVLPAGVWQMSGSHSSIYGGRWNPLDLFALQGDPPIAYMECWTATWPITITKREGWNGTPLPDDKSFLRNLPAKRGTNGRPCGSHI